MLTRNDKRFLESSSAFICEVKKEEQNEDFFERCDIAIKRGIPRYLFFINRKKYPVKLLRKLLIEYRGWNKVYFINKSWHERFYEVKHDVKCWEAIDKWNSKK